MLGTIVICSIIASGYYIDDQHCSGSVFSDFQSFFSWETICVLKLHILMVWYDSYMFAVYQFHINGSIPFSECLLLTCIGLQRVKNSWGFILVLPSFMTYLLWWFSHFILWNRPLRHLIQAICQHSPTLLAETSMIAMCKNEFFRRYGNGM